MAKDKQLLVQVEIHKDAILNIIAEGIYTCSLREPGCCFEMKQDPQYMDNRMLLWLAQHGYKNLIPDFVIGIDDYKGAYLWNPESFNNFKENIERYIDNKLLFCQENKEHATNFHFRLNRDMLIYLFEHQLLFGLGSQYSIMCKEYGDDEDWIGITYDDSPEYFKLNTDHITYEIFMNNE